MRPAAPLDEDDDAAFRHMLVEGSLGAVGLATDDCHQTYEELSAKGVTFVEEPAERPRRRADPAEQLRQLARAGRTAALQP